MELGQNSLWGWKVKGKMTMVRHPEGFPGTQSSSSEILPTPPSKAEY